MKNDPRSASRALTAFAAMSLVACGATEPDQRKADAPVAQGGPPAEPAAPPPAPAALVLTPEGLGPLRIGMTLAEVTAAMGPDADPQAAGGAEPERCDQFRPARAPDGVLAMVEDGRLTRISLIGDSAIRTDRGVGLGSAAAAVKAAYQDAVATPHKYVEAPAAYVTHWSRKAVAGDQATPSDRGIVFEIDRRGLVGMIHAGSPSIRYVEGCS